MLLNPLMRRPPPRLGFPVMRGAFPVVGHIPALATDNLGLYRVAEEELGLHFWLDAGFGLDVLQCVSPEVFAIFKNKATSSSYMKSTLGPLVGGSLIVHDGPQHQHMRSAMNGAFMPRGLTSAGVGDITAGIIERRVRSWVGRAVRVLPETRESALEVMFRICGITDPDLTAWRRQYEELALLALNVPLDFPGSPRRRGLAGRAWLDERLVAMVRAARSKDPDTTMLGALVRAKDDEGRPLEEHELVDNLRLLLFAGHETSGSTMAWLTAILAQHPDAWERLLAEVEAQDGMPRSPADLRAFPFAEALFRETLRLYPPLPTEARRVVADFELAGRTIPAGVNIGFSIIHLSRSRALFERPDEFLPERWIGRDHAPTPLELVQFGGGPHFCLGYHLAWLELVQFAVALARDVGGRGGRPRIVGPPPRLRYMPLLHPSSRTRVAFD